MSRLGDRSASPWFGFATWQVTLAVALFVLGFLVAAQLQSEAPRTTYTSQERAPLVQTAIGLQAQQDTLKSRLLGLRAQIEDLEGRSKGNSDSVKALNDALDKARIAAGLTGLHGTGLVIQLEDSTNQVPPGANETDYRVSADDVRAVVRELWLAGAEAVAINDERVTGSTAVLDIGGSVLVNSAYVSPPYQIAAIGPTELYPTMTATPSFVAFVRARAETFGIRISFAQPPDVTVPGFVGSLNLRYGVPQPASPNPSPSTAP